MIARDVRDREQRDKLFKYAVFIGDTVISDLALLRCDPIARPPIERKITMRTKRVIIVSRSILR